MSEGVVAADRAHDGGEPARSPANVPATPLAKGAAKPPRSKADGTAPGRRLRRPTAAAKTLASRRGPVLVLAAGLLTSGALLISFASQLWFFGDDWAFLLHRGTVAGSDRGLLSPHNEHWSTVPILVFRAIFAMVGLREYLPYALPVIAAHLGVVTLMYLLLVRFGTSRWVAVAVALFLAFFGAAADNTLWDFQMGLVGSVFFGLLALWLYAGYERRSNEGRRDDGARLGWGWPNFPVWGAALLALMCQGSALAMVVGLSVYVAAASGLRRAVVVASVPVGVYAAWSLGFGWYVPSVGGSAWDYTRVPQYVSIGLTSATERIFAIPGSGLLFLALLIGAAFLIRSTPARLRYFAWAGITAAVAQFVLSGLARVHGDVEAADAGRYAYIVAVLMAPVLALVLQRVADRLPAPRWVPTCLVAGLVGLAVVNGVRITHEYWEVRRDEVGTARERVLGAATLVNQGAPLLAGQLDTFWNKDVTTERLRRPEIRAALPAETPTATGLLEAASTLQVGVSQAPLPVPLASRAALSAGFGAAASSGGCQDYVVPAKAGLFLKLPPTKTGSQVRITGPTTVLRTRLIRGALLSSETAWSVQWGQPIHVGTSASDATLRISLSGGGSIQLCTA